MKKHLNSTFEFDLQLFADGDDGNNSEVNEETSEAPEVHEKKSVKTYTDEEVNAIVASKLARERDKQEKARKEAEEAEKFKNMNEQQKLDARIKKMEKELSEYKQRETESRMTTVAREAMSEAGVNVPDSILKSLIATKAEETKANVDAFIKIFNDAVTSQVASKLHTEDPKKGTRPASSLTREQILSTKDTLQRQKLMSENPDLFPELSGLYN